MAADACMYRYGLGFRVKACMYRYGSPQSNSADREERNQQHSHLLRHPFYEYTLQFIKYRSRKKDQQQQVHRRQLAFEASYDVVEIHRRRSGLRTHTHNPSATHHDCTGTDTLASKVWSKFHAEDSREEIKRTETGRLRYVCLYFRLDGSRITGLPSTTS